MAPLSSHGGQYRHLRNVLIAVVTVFLLHALVSRGFMALRGGPTKTLSMPAMDDEEVQNREEVEHWDPQPDNNSNKWGGTPAKGGVEIYPLQVCDACEGVCVRVCFLCWRAKVPSWHRMKGFRVARLTTPFHSFQNQPSACGLWRYLACWFPIHVEIRGEEGTFRSRPRHYSIGGRRHSVLGADRHRRNNANCAVQRLFRHSRLCDAHVAHGKE